jgi:hypothetical protein
VAGVDELERRRQPGEAAADDRGPHLGPLLVPNTVIHPFGCDGRSGKAATAFERHRKRRLMA